MPTAALLLFSLSITYSIGLDHKSFDGSTTIKETNLCSPMGITDLGMESGAIVDSAIEASSSYSEYSVGPQNARLNKDLSGGAWCPARQLNAANSGKEYIQVNLTQRHVITAVATQGRFGNGLGVEFAEYYWVEYSRDGGKIWHKWRNRHGRHEIAANSDTYSVVRSVLELPIVGANFIRIFPMSEHLRTICLRFELYGCLYRDGPIVYSTPDGLRGSKFGDLVDATYDGERDSLGHLSNGLGQLSDGIKGDDNYKVNKGFEWIGWRSGAKETLDLMFEFEEIRNFTSASFYCHNLFTKDIKVFSSARVRFSYDGVKWSKVPIEFAYMPDNVIEKGRDVIMHLQHRTGRFVKFELRFGSKWLLISEVRFFSQPVADNFVESDTALMTEHTKETLTPIATAAINESKSMIKQSTVLIIFSVFGVVTASSVVIFLVRSHYRRKDKCAHGGAILSQMGDISFTPLYCEPHDSNMKTSDNLSGTYADPEYAVPDVISGGSPVIASTSFVVSTFSPRTDCKPSEISKGHNGYYASNVVQTAINDLVNRNNEYNASSPQSMNRRLKNEAREEMECMPELRDVSISTDEREAHSRLFGSNCNNEFCLLCEKRKEFIRLQRDYMRHQRDKKPRRTTSD